jgi:hypothetical protein
MAATKSRRCDVETREPTKKQGAKMISKSLVLMALLAAGPVHDTHDADAAAYQGTSAGVRYYDFDDDSIEGEILSADGVNVLARRGARHASMIDIRSHFINELHRIALDL